MLTPSEREFLRLLALAIEADKLPRLPDARVKELLDEMGKRDA